jgi:hypothetical protein
MPIEIKRTCEFCRERFENGLPTCECCLFCGGTPTGDWACEKCIPARDMAKTAARAVWREFVRQEIQGI